MPLAAQSPPAPEVTLRLSSDRILLGEPVWVLVTARNTSPVALQWNPGYYCRMLATFPVTAIIPDATPGPGTPKPCAIGGSGGSCGIGRLTTLLAPGASATWRFLLEGDFHFTRAGTYQVQLTAHPGKADLFRWDSTATVASIVPVTETRVLVVLPKDDAALLARERQMAMEMEDAMLRASGRAFPTEEAFREWRNLQEVRRGLAAQPVPGMETVFAGWLQLSNDYEVDAIAGLKSVNTTVSREMLATIARAPSKPNNFTQNMAIEALADLGDRSYYPLMVQLLGSGDERVRVPAIRGIANLGAEDGVARLLELVRTASSRDGRFAVNVLGNTKSRTAVKGLIDLTAPATGRDPAEVDWPLFVLTHHRLPPVAVPRTAEQAHVEWQRWWETTGKDAPVYSPFECAPRGRGGTSGIGPTAGPW